MHVAVYMNVYVYMHVSVYMHVYVYMHVSAYLICSSAPSMAQPRARKDGCTPARVYMGAHAHLQRSLECGRGPGGCVSE